MIIPGVQWQDRHCEHTMRRDLLAMLDVERPGTPTRDGAPRVSGPALTGRAGYVGRNRVNPLRVTVTAAERKEITDRAAAAGLSDCSSCGWWTGRGRASWRSRSGACSTASAICRASWPRSPAACELSGREVTWNDDLA